MMSPSEKLARLLCDVARRNPDTENLVTGDSWWKSYLPDADRFLEEYHADLRKWVAEAEQRGRNAERERWVRSAKAREKP
jgi:hypothetical protein